MGRDSIAISEGVGDRIPGNLGLVVHPRMVESVRGCEENGGHVGVVTTMRLGRHRKWVEVETGVDMRGKDRVARVFIGEHEDHIVEVDEMLAVLMAFVSDSRATEEFSVDMGHVTSTWKGFFEKRTIVLSIQLLHHLLPAPRSTWPTPLRHRVYLLLYPALHTQRFLVSHPLPLSMRSVENMFIVVVNGGGGTAGFGNDEAAHGAREGVAPRGRKGDAARTTSSTRWFGGDAGDDGVSSRTTVGVLSAMTRLGVRESGPGAVTGETVLVATSRSHGESG